MWTEKPYPMVLSQKSTKDINYISFAYPKHSTPKKEMRRLAMKEESAPPDKKKKAAAIIFIGGRIFELESESMEVDET
jgi:tRNA U34 2-thiouridine synthase MnmA/TrmU